MRKKLSAYFYIKKLIDAVLYTTIIWVALFLVFYDSAIVYDISMQPTLNAISGVSDNDLVYYRRWAEAEIGDIVIIDTGDNNLIIKRLIAVAGDRVRYEYNDETNVYDLYINNIVQTEDYIKENITISKLQTSNNPLKYVDITDSTGFNPLGLLKSNQPENFDEYGNYIVPENQVFVMGDNRIYSTDSKSYGGYDKSTIVGVVQMIIRADDNKFVKVLDFVF